ncbi:uncharacterized protein LOC108031560 [Drosophila biarmipes]|uniref:uncharacterized protein LOC108031560 n=1 Tax=Drosophila biarmipes TaxID=125945 RepID=UPI0007E669B3|nr:uncharacterized protein LOC108031560 [Drosophila biarmipes]
MGNHPQTGKLLFLSCLATALLVPLGTLAVGHKDIPLSVGLVHRSKRTMTTICVEITPSSSQDEPYYMCRDPNFGGENVQQNCVEVRNQGAQGEPFYMCREVESTTLGARKRSHPGFSTPLNFHDGIKHDSGHNFPFFPAFDGWSTTNKHDHPARSTTYQDKPHHHPLSQQQQPHAHYRFYGTHLVAPSSAPSVTSYGFPKFSQPIVDSPPTNSPGSLPGPGAAATTPSHDTEEPVQISNVRNKERIVGHNQRRFNFENDILAVTDEVFQRDKLNQELGRPRKQAYPEDQLMRVSLSDTEKPENDPVMKAFYSSLAGAEVVAQAGNKPAYVPIEPTGEMASRYSPYEIQYLGASASPSLSPPPSTYSEAELSNAPNQYCSGHSTSVPTFHCLTQPDKRVSLRSSCPSFQPVIITMPCYGQRQPAPYIDLPRTQPEIARSQSMVIPFGVDQGPIISPFELGFGSGSQFGSPFGMKPQIGAQEYDMEHQVGAPFGMGMRFGMGWNPFGPFGTLNPFNHFNRILGGPTASVLAPKHIQRVFNINHDDKVRLTTETAPHSEAPTAISVKLHFSSSTPTPFTPEHPNPILGTHHDSFEDEDLHEDYKAETTPLPVLEANDSTPEIPGIVSKAADLLKPKQRKRHNSRSIGRISQKQRYLQQL